MEKMLNDRKAFRCTIETPLVARKYSEAKGNIAQDKGLATKLAEGRRGGGEVTRKITAVYRKAGPPAETPRVVPSAGTFVPTSIPRPGAILVVRKSRKEDRDQ